MAFRPQGGGPNNPGLIRPEYKIVRNVSGGLNASKPPDQLEDTESPDMQNLVYLQDSLCVDFGIRKLGSKVVGIPQKEIPFRESDQGILFQLLVTTLTLYLWNQSRLDWDPVPTSVGSNPTVSTTINGTGSGSTSGIVFSGSATWTSGQLVAIEYTDSMSNFRGWLVGTAGGTTSPLTISAFFPVADFIFSGSEIFPLPTFTSDGNRPISFCVDPERDFLIFCNGHDPIQRFDETKCIQLEGTAAANISSAGYVIRYHSITVLGGTVESGNTFPYRIRRSATGDSTNWTTLDSGFDDLLDTGDPITGLVAVNPYLIIPCSNSIVRASYLGNGQQVFWYNYGLSHTGTIGAQAFSFDKTRMELVSEAGIFGYVGDQGVTNIGHKIYDAILNYSGDLNPSRHDFLFMFYVANLDETWIFYPSGQSLWANRVLRYVHETGAWFIRQFPSSLSFSGFGFFQTPNAVRWIDLTGSWMSRHKPWNARSSQGNFQRIALTGATDNQVYLYDFNTSTTDDGQIIPWYFVSKDYPIPQNWETLDGITVYGTGIVDLIEISTDFGKNYLPLATNITLGPTWNRADADCSLTTEFIRVRFSGSDPSFKLSWFAFKTMMASER